MANQAADSVTAEQSIPNGDQSLPEPEANGQLPSPKTETTPTRPKRPNYTQIHARPLPLEVHPLPAFIPHNPLSLLRIAHIYLSQVLYPPSSYPSPRYEGYFSPQTCSVHVTNPRSVRALWEMGFFGKGTLSRSEPQGLENEKRRLGLAAGETSEEITRKRREERNWLKNERARLVREAVERRLEEERAAPEAGGTEGKGQTPELETLSSSNGHVQAAETEIPGLAKLREILLKDATRRPPNPLPTEIAAHPTPKTENGQISEEPQDEEHLQLTLPEAFFLCYALGVLEIKFPSDSVDITAPPLRQVKSPQPPSLLRLFRAYSYLPPLQSFSALRPDDPFLLHYVVYHHFRSLGWIIRPGSKFAVDYLLYLRGPVFSHAEFAVLIVPDYGDRYWTDHPDQVRNEAKGKEWFWMHCINRVQSQVLKTLVLVYVSVPAPIEEADDRADDVGSLLKRYKVREVAMRRWIPNRNLKSQAR